MPIGARVTLRDERMWEFLDRFINITLPRIRDFRGLSTKLSGGGDYTLGLKDQLIFPEIDYDKVDEPRGMNVTIVTTASTDEEGREMLRLMGVPFRRS
jgi:large subunit ribosomal protein L5